MEHLLAGHGPVFNAGERVEAYTNPLWVALLAAGAVLGAPVARTAVVLGLGLAVAGLAAVGAAARRPGPDPGAGLPLGMAVLVALPPMWDFATSGLETGLSLGWMGGAAWLLARRLAHGPPSAPDPAAGRKRPRSPWAVSAFLGLGPLIRPDLLIFSTAFLLALLVIDREARVRAGDQGSDAGRAIRLVLVALALPLAYQAFRMGYFAGLVPNTALAKEAGLAHWPQGRRYLLDFLETYHLGIPLALLLPWLVRLVRDAVARRDRPGLALALLPAAAGLAHAAYVVRVGGDFMHARLLLPSLFGLLLPVAVVTLPPPARLARRRLAGAAAGIVALWALVCAAALRNPYPGLIGPEGIADERGFYVRYTGRANPVDPADFAGTSWAVIGRSLRERAASGSVPGPRWLVFVDRAVPLASGVSPDVGLAAIGRNIGILGYSAGPRVHLVDEWGLSDPLASRLWLTQRTRPGHEKSLPEAWVVARFADPASPESMSPDVLAARQALACGDLARLREAVEAPLGPRRFLANALLAPRLHRLRIPADPGTARVALCGSAPAGA